MSLSSPLPREASAPLGLARTLGISLAPTFEELLHHVDDGLAIIDGRGRLLWHNAAFARIARGAPADLCREALADGPRLFPWREPGAQSSGEGTAWSLASSSTRRALEVEACPLPHDHDHDLIIVRDVTELRRLERRALEGERQGTFGMLAAGVAHEINNVLVGLAGYAELASVSLHDPLFLQSVFATYTEQCERLRKLTEDFLSFSRPDPEEIQDIDLAQELHAVAGSLGRMGRLRRCRFEVRVQAGLPTIRGEGVQIQQLLVNLLLHAAERSPEGGEVIASLARSACGRRIELTLRDSGRPMAAAEQANLVDPFLTPEMRAWVNGLGMLVVRRIAERHGADIHVESDGPEGTAVRVRFPFA